jgi:hypothetical protein
MTSLTFQPSPLASTRLARLGSSGGLPTSVRLRSVSAAIFAKTFFRKKNTTSEEPRKVVEQPGLKTYQRSRLEMSVKAAEQDQITVKLIGHWEQVCQKIEELAKAIPDASIACIRTGQCK